MVFSVKSALGVAVLALSPVVLAAAIPEPGSIWVRQDFGSCRNQSCAVATVSGSTGSSVYDFSSYPVGDTQDGNCCIVRYFPAAKDALYKARPGLQQYCASHGGDAPLDKNPPGITTVTVVNPKSKRATCKANILIYSKGTLEPGDLGITLGPQIKAGLDAKLWEVRGVQYDNSFANDYCLGLPGGINVRQALAKAVSDCPNARIHMSGYSQGALVTRNALARAAASDVAKVANVVTFGDPFVGAKIGQYSGPIHVFCAQGDGVCNGQLDVGLAHLSYFANVNAGVALLKAGQANA
ncbi:carbohydrate esterase family 5 protein [Dissoconium aciculare CBS 342.82]|uniref:cutinase n=1 Tax=Dissoconium aciculare CBS 342.82 TaxID=1314786 RepID=A0A6J3MFA7_9PEZI|nr:carbohydrate esterase family 5 protein [Dissoconium aciculare CBS 342.82]KAF1826696.1 carbohydrate esterase family 5 protein [Dissoconium aciculare CBS 342.82]